ncbi:MAG: 16S rRNA (uracil(1498)-N(3))-methyltransferase [Pseudomonadota bacterium]
MPSRVDFKSQRLFVDHQLAPERRIELSPDQARYLLTVLRMESGAELLVFNGAQGEWRARVERQSKKAGSLEILHQTREQPRTSDVWLLFAPIRRGRIEFLVEKAVEMGVTHLVPVITDHTQHAKLRIDKLKATIIEAAEQCGVLNVPSIVEPVALLPAIERCQQTDRTLIFCDEMAEVADPRSVLDGLKGQPVALLIGPEGGFSPGERELLGQVPNARIVALGPRILRAETAAIAGLTLVQLLVGDWTD